MEELSDDGSSGGSCKRQQKRWRKLQTTTATEAAADDSNSNRESFGRWRRKLQTMTLWAKEASNVSVDRKEVVVLPSTGKGATHRSSDARGDCARKLHLRTRPSATKEVSVLCIDGGGNGRDTVEAEAL
ncbi:hypothetical protein BHE74_00008069 [Ensete ventricosum]|nr:hypothetical protein BHE74_00008069 [Ensete ventricosum]RZR89630.1 hypothetical protein BHM03_00017399 [Ensete ventricosum]